MSLGEFRRKLINRDRNAKTRFRTKQFSYDQTDYLMGYSEDYVHTGIDDVFDFVDALHDMQNRGISYTELDPSQQKYIEQMSLQIQSAFTSELDWPEFELAEHLSATPDLRHAAEIRETPLYQATVEYATHHLACPPTDITISDDMICLSDVTPTFYFGDFDDDIESIEDYDKYFFLRDFPLLLSQGAFESIDIDFFLRNITCRGPAQTVEEFKQMVLKERVYMWYRQNASQLVILDIPDVPNPVFSEMHEFSFGEVDVELLDFFSQSPLLTTQIVLSPNSIVYEGVPNVPPPSGYVRVIVTRREIKAGVRVHFGLSDWVVHFLYTCLSFDKRLLHPP